MSCSKDHPSTNAPKVCDIVERTWLASALPEGPPTGLWKRGKAMRADGARSGALEDRAGGVAVAREGARREGRRTTMFTWVSAVSGGDSFGDLDESTSRAGSKSLPRSSLRSMA